MLNFSLLRHWENWATIILMVSIAFFAFNSLAKFANIHERSN